MRAAAAGVAALAATGPVAVVHGGGRAIDADLRARGKAPRFVDGLRVTDDDTLDDGRRGAGRTHQHRVRRRAGRRRRARRSA